MRSLITYIAAILFITIYVAKDVVTTVPQLSKQVFTSQVLDLTDTETESTENKKEAEPKALYINNDFFSWNELPASVPSINNLPAPGFFDQLICRSIPTPPPEL